MKLEPLLAHTPRQSQPWLASAAALHHCLTQRHLGSRPACASLPTRCEPPRPRSPRDGSSQLGQKYFVQPRPDAGRDPVPQTPPGRRPAAADLFRGCVPPAHALAQHVNDSPQHSPVIRGQPPGDTDAAWAAVGATAAPRVLTGHRPRSADTQQVALTVRLARPVDVFRYQVTGSCESPQTRLPLVHVSSCAVSTSARPGRPRTTVPMATCNSTRARLAPRQ